MGRPRMELQQILKAIPGIEEAYFQPPEGQALKFPCIVYSLDEIDVTHADNQPYLLHEKYEATVIDSDPDSDIPKVVARMPKCRMTRRFVSNNRNHTVFNLFF